MNKLAADALEASDSGSRTVAIWRQAALHCHELAENGKSHEGVVRFRTLNRQIGRYLSSREPSTERFEVVVAELNQLLSEVSAWNPTSGITWRWTFHHALIE